MNGAKNGGSVAYSSGKDAKAAIRSRESCKTEARRSGNSSSVEQHARQPKFTLIPNA
jgi:hypothetical protein